MNSIYKKIYSVGDNSENSPDFGASPLSKVGRKLIKDATGKKQHGYSKDKELEIYNRPAGIVKVVKYVPNKTVGGQLSSSTMKGVSGIKEQEGLL